MAEHVLITGVSGFIGGHLAAGLHAHGYEVSGIDLRPMSPQLERIVTRFTLADLRAPGALQATLDGCRPDRVIHLAAQVGRVLGEDDLRHQRDPGKPAGIGDERGHRGVGSRGELGTRRKTLCVPSCSPVCICRRLAS